MLKLFRCYICNSKDILFYFRISFLDKSDDFVSCMILPRYSPDTRNPERCSDIKKFTREWLYQNSIDFLRVEVCLPFVILHTLGENVFVQNAFIQNIGMYAIKIV